jgi:hypothetical protein
MRPSTVGATTPRTAGEVSQARPHGHGSLGHRHLTPGLAQRGVVQARTQITVDRRLPGFLSGLSVSFP